MNPEDLFAKGYAIPSYDILKGVRWQWKSEVITLPDNAVTTLNVGDFEVARIEDIRDVLKTMKGEYLG